MADEIQMSARLYASKNGASINAQTWTAVANMTGTDMGQTTQEVGTSDEVLSITADLALPYKCLVYNMDLQYSVYLGPSSPYSFEIPPQEFILIPRANATLYVKAVTNPLKIFAQFCEI